MWIFAPVTLALPLSPALESPDVGQLTAPVRLEVDGQPIDSGPSIAHSGPALLDLDGDGVPELLVGNFRGTIDVFGRDRASAEPAWKARGKLQCAGEDLTVPNW